MTILVAGHLSRKSVGHARKPNGIVVPLEKVISLVQI